MPRLIRLMPWARDDLSSIRRWQTQPGSGVAAKRRVLAILVAIERLRDLPCLYARSEHPGLRELPCKGHRVVYRTLDVVR
jgi:plasmid stabilization system protein ParE